MNVLKKEKTLLSIIRFGPIFFVLVISFSITQVLLSEEKNNHKQELELIKNTYLEKNKQRVKEEVEEVYKYIQKEKSKSEQVLKENIRNRVHEAHKIATTIYNTGSNSDTHNHSKEHIFDTIKDVLGNIIYNNGRGYYFIDDVNGVKLLQPLNKSFEGVNLSEYKDAKGYQFVDKIKDTIKNKTESYDSYYWYKPKDKTQAYKKISFYKYFEPFNVAIGTGEYVDEFENELKKKLLEKIKDIKFGDNGYIFIYDLQGNCLSHYKKELIGKNRLNYQDKNGKFLVKDILNYVKEQKQGFVSYNSTFKPNDNILTTSKISYLKQFEDWGWVIGTGFYLEALKKELEKKKELLISSEERAIKQIVYSSIVMTLIFIIFSFIVSRYIETIFNEYKKSLKKEINLKLKKEKMLVQQSKMATMGEMIGNIAHQWKQPLNLISMSNGLLKVNQDVKDFSSKEDLDEAIDNIDVSVEHLSTTIDDFRNFFKPEKQKKDYSSRSVIEKTLKLISSQFKNNNIEIIKNMEDTRLHGYPNELLQVLINIIKNAKDELVKLEKDKDRLLFISTYEDNGKAIIKIKDNAGGIPENIIDKVFKAYFTTKSENDGTGIGLYMSKQIIEGMNGKLSVLNREYDFDGVKYKGAEFIISLNN